MKLNPGPYGIQRVGFHFMVSGQGYNNRFAYEDQAHYVLEALNIGYSQAKGPDVEIEDIKAALRKALEVLEAVDCPGREENHSEACIRCEALGRNKG